MKLIRISGFSLLATGALLVAATALSAPVNAHTVTAIGVNVDPIPGPFADKAQLIQWLNWNCPQFCPADLVAAAGLNPSDPGLAIPAPLGADTEADGDENATFETSDETLPETGPEDGSTGAEVYVLSVVGGVG